MEENRIQRIAMQYKTSCEEKRRRSRRTRFNGIRETMEKRRNRERVESRQAWV